MLDLLFCEDEIVLQQAFQNYDMLKTITLESYKYSDNEAGSRSYAVEKTLEKAKQAALKMGMVSLEDISAMDETSIYVFSASTKDYAIINHGKGVSAEQAQMSACMEFIERISARMREISLLNLSYNELKKNLYDKVLKPSSLITNYQDIVADDNPINWYHAVDLSNSSFKFVPTVTILYPYFDDRFDLIACNTNGLASGSTFIEAIIQGIYEVIERDSYSVAFVSNRVCDVKLTSITSKIALKLIREFQNQHIKIYIKYISNEFGFPCFAVVGDDEKSADSMLLSGGLGCHSNKEIALLRALTELAQSRKTIIQGKRENMLSMRPHHECENDYTRVKRNFNKWFSNSSEQINFEDITTYKFEDLKSELLFIINVLKKQNFDIYAVNLTPNELVNLFCVVRVIIPGLENFTDDGRMGERCLKHITDFEI